jgi:DNA-binding CsgD family transcriptional regulator
MLYRTMYTSGRGRMTNQAGLEHYATELERRLIEAPQETDAWRELINRGLQEAYAERNLVGLASMAHSMASELDSRGCFAEALELLDHVHAFARREPDALAMVVSMRGCFLLTKGLVEEAVSAAAEVEALAPDLQSAHAVSTAASSALMIRLAAMEAGAGLAAEAWLGDAEMRSSAALFVASWYVPYLFAQGELASARHWTRALQLGANAADHRWRQSDANVFEAADSLVLHPAGRVEARVISVNHLGLARRATLRLYGAVRTADWHPAELALNDFASRVATLGASSVGGVEHFNAVLEAHRDGRLTAEPSIPSAVHLGNLAATLAAGEAIAYAGSQSAAAAWLERWPALVPDGVETSLEWPSSARRVQALLAIRSGETSRVSRGLLLKAIAWTGAVGYPAEHQLARLQLSELYESIDFMVPERLRTVQRREAWDALRALGIPPSQHVYAVSRSAMMVASERGITRLSNREAQVLQLLADGLTYREAGEALGIRWRTVQTLAHRLYDKLGVSGRIPAIDIARELGILPPARSAEPRPAGD